MEKKPVELPQNTVIGSWKTSILLGRGGQGGVWAVKPAKHRRSPPRALKACFATDEQSRARFVREVELLRRCDSTNVLKVYDADLEWKEHVLGEPSFAYYVGEKCQGSMEERQASLGDMRQRLELFKQACAAVSYLHTMPDPVLHRDIKPANFLIANELSNVLLADFGIARALADKTLTQAFEVVGTPYYRAPEVLHGAQGSVQSDVYSLGRLLEWLLTGDISTDMGTRSVPRGGALDDDACNVLDGIIAKSTQVNLAHRYHSVQSLAEQIPDLWLSIRPRPKLGPILPDTTAAVVLPAALELVRSDDMLGWRRLQGQLRRDFVERVLPWRAENERKWREEKSACFKCLDSLLAISMGRLIFGLAGVYSGKAAFADQRQVVDDLLSIPNWSSSGITAIIEAPSALVFLFQYLHGALCMANGQMDLALQLARMQVPDRNGSNTEQLWRERRMTGWPRLLAQNCTWAFEYMRGLRGWHVALEQFFALESDYEIALASYSMLMVLYETAHDAATSMPEMLANPESFRLDFPPLFLGMTREINAVAARKTFRNRQLLANVAAQASTNVDSMRTVWPARRKLIFRWGSEVFNRYYYDGDLHDPVPLEL